MKPIDMKELMDKLERINEDIGHEGNDQPIVHASATRALAREIVQYAKRVADQNNVDISDDNGRQIWEGIVARQLSDGIKGLQEHVNEARIEVEYLSRYKDI